MLKIILNALIGVAVIGTFTVSMRLVNRHVENGSSSHGELEGGFSFDSSNFAGIRFYEILKLLFNCGMLRKQGVCSLLSVASSTWTEDA